MKGGWAAIKNTKYPLEPIKKYATKQEFDKYPHCLGLVRSTEIGESQAMMEMFKNESLANLHDISRFSTDIERMHMGPEIWYKQKKVLSPDWKTGLEGETVTCEDVTFKWSTSLPILEGCLTVTCEKWENGKSISSMDTGSASQDRLGSSTSTWRRPSSHAAS